MLHSVKKFLYWVQKMHSFYNLMRISRSRSSKLDDFGSNWKRAWDFLL